MVAEGFDVAIRFGEPEPSALIARRLFEVRILTCCSPEYIARRGRPKVPRELETARHECLLFRDPITGRPFPWEFHQGKKRMTVAVSGRLIVNDALTQLEACLAGRGIAQIMNLNSEPLFKNNRLVNLFPEWSDELFPLYLYHTSRRFVPAKVRALSDFILSALKNEP
jgi:DNA-binding transcriptional LysR family regulator